MSAQSYKVVEIFKSIEGEGKRVGQPCTFIRLYGCNLKCSYCDTMYANTGEQYKEMYLDDIHEIVKSFGIENITITGGEPLIQSGIEQLIKFLCDNNYKVNIETNGSVPISKFSGVFNYISGNKLFLTVDYKCPSSGCEDLMCYSNFKNLGENDVLKFVVATEQDLKTVKTVCKLLEPNCAIYVSPVFGKIDYETLANFVINSGIKNITMQIQLHKIIWAPDKRGV